MDQSESAGIGGELETVAIWAGPTERIQGKQATLKISLGQPWLRATKSSCKGHSRAELLETGAPACNLAWRQ